MTRAMSELSGRIHATWPSPTNESLHELCISLLRRQQSSWAQLASGYTALRDIRTREVQCDGYSVVIQHNAKRLISTGAKVDPLSIAERKCFLCAANLPAEQKSVLFRDEFLILCNPVPIFDIHFTIAHCKHVPQGIEESSAVFLELAQAMSPAFTVFYNGPKCGASAPDHLHFQASPMGAIPIEKDVVVRKWYASRRAIGSAALSTLKHAGRQTIVIEGSDSESVHQAFSRLMSAAKQVLHTPDEPMLNVLCSYSDRLWRMIVFLRRKHRPDAFFKKGDGHATISPAAVDVGGLIIAPIERDFKRIDAEMVQAIYDEVVLEQKVVDLILSTV